MVKKKYYARKIQKSYRRYRKRKRRKSKLPIKNKQRIKRLQNIVYQDLEHRWIDRPIITADIPGGPGLILDLMAISTITIGDNRDNRTGSRISLRKFYFKGQIICADDHNWCRIICFKQLQNGAITSADLLQADPTSTYPTIFSPYAKLSRVKFRILMDKTYRLQRQSAGSTRHVLLPCDFSLNFPGGQEINYQSTTPTTGTIVGENIQFLFLSDSGSPTHPSVRGFGRTSFFA